MPGGKKNFTRGKVQPDGIRSVCESEIQYGNGYFWARGYYVDTIGQNRKQIGEYVRNQLQEDELEDQMSIREYVDPFTGCGNKRA